MKIVLIGSPGSGKSTQGKLLSQKLGIPYLASGGIFRKMAKEKTKWGQYVRKTMNAGLLIPDKKVISIVEEYLKKESFKKGYVLDGFPRTVFQVKNFSQKIDKVFYIKLSDKEALRRLMARKEEIREDDSFSTVKKRMNVYHQLTDPIIEYYRKMGILEEINGDRNIEEIHKDVMARFKL